jgi:hypothetical protein
MLLCNKFIHKGMKNEKSYVHKCSGRTCDRLGHHGSLPHQTKRRPSLEVVRGMPSDDAVFKVNHCWYNGARRAPFRFVIRFRQKSHQRYTKDPLYAPQRHAAQRQKTYAHHSQGARATQDELAAQSEGGRHTRKAGDHSPGN